MHDSPIRILCVDDHPIVQEGLALIINREYDMKVVGTAADGLKAIGAYDTVRPDVTLMDLQLPRMNGVAAIRAIIEKDSRARIIVLTMYDGDEDIYRALDAGAATYVLKDTLSDDLIRTIREVHDGRRPLASDMRAQLEMRGRQRQLTNREFDVVRLVAQGLRNKDVAARLHIRNETVHVHLKNIFAKLKVKDRTEAVFVANRRGIIHLEHTHVGSWDRTKHDSPQ